MSATALVLISCTLAVVVLLLIVIVSWVVVRVLRYKHHHNISLTQHHDVELVATTARVRESVILAEEGVYMEPDNNINSSLGENNSSSDNMSENIEKVDITEQAVVFPDTEQPDSCVTSTPFNNTILSRVSNSNSRKRDNNSSNINIEENSNISSNEDEGKKEKSLSNKNNSMCDINSSFSDKTIMSDNNGNNTNDVKESTINTEQSILAACAAQQDFGSTYIIDITEDNEVIEQALEVAEEELTLLNTFEQRLEEILESSNDTINHSTLEENNNNSNSKPRKLLQQTIGNSMINITFV